MTLDSVQVPTPTAVDEEILAALRSLKARVFPATGQVVLTDVANTEPNLTMASELVECFMVPALFGGLREQVRDLLPPEDACKLMDAVLDIRDQNAFAGNEPFLAGSYLSPVAGVGQRAVEDREIVDAASFALTACLHFRELYGKEMGPSLEAKTADVIDEALDFLDRSSAMELDSDGRARLSGGWCWGKDGIRFAYRYFTYVALDGVMDFIRCLDRQDKVKLVGEKAALREAKMRELVRQSVEPLYALLLEDEAITKGPIALTDDVTGKSPTSWYYNLWTAYALLAIRPEAVRAGVSEAAFAKLGQAMELLAAEFAANPERDDFIAAEVNLGIVDKRDRHVTAVGMWSDRSFGPLLLKAHSAYTRSQGARTSRTDEQAAIVWTALLQRRDPEFAGVWDRAGGGYSIYYTERAIEGLVKLKDYLALPVSSGRGAKTQQTKSATDDTAPITVNIPVAELRALLGELATGMADGQDDLVAALADQIRNSISEAVEAKLIKSGTAIPAMEKTLKRLDDEGAPAILHLAVLVSTLTSLGSVHRASKSAGSSSE